MFFWALVFKHPQSVFIPQETKFHTHLEKRVELWFYVIWSSYSQVGDSKVQDSELNCSCHTCIPPLSWPSYACFPRRYPTEILNAFFAYPMSILSYIAL
jgi:hypothetical protein